MEANGPGGIRQGFNPYVEVRVAAVEALGLFTERVLVHGQDFRVQDGIAGGDTHVVGIDTQDERGSQQAPEAEVGAVLGVGAAGAHPRLPAMQADDRHIGVVPVARAGISGYRGVFVVDDLVKAPTSVEVAIPGVFDVSADAPHVGVVSGPSPRLGAAMLAHAEEDGPASVAQRRGHGDILGRDIARRIIGHGPVIIFQEIESPGGYLVGIVGFVSEAARVTRVSLLAAAQIDAGFQAF